MRPTPTNTSSVLSPKSRFWSFTSPLPYLFGGLALMLLLITAALIILACSYRKRRPSSDHDKAAQPSSAVSSADDTPKIVVIMAGENNPTHIAVPIRSSAFVPETHVCVCKV